MGGFGVVVLLLLLVGSIGTLGIRKTCLNLPMRTSN
jgi:hypothetical protein